MIVLARFVTTDDKGNDQTKTFKGDYSDILDQYKELVYPDDWTLEDAYLMNFNGTRFEQGNIFWKVTDLINRSKSE
tara:strand:- start:516 stop:743 length:228 start_codon:yes stop_codon:yes gene_type:complete